MRVSNTLYITKRSQWRAWLKKNFNKKTDIWLLFPYKVTGKPRISYIDAVEEALCFGWIDSIVKPLSKEAYCQRFSPRKGAYSQLNTERMRKLIKANKVHESVLNTYKHRKFVLPKDIIAIIKQDKQTYKHFKAFPADYKRVRLAFIVESRPQDYQKRLAFFLKKTKNNKRFGML